MIRLALLDMNNGITNQGFGNMVEIAEAFKEDANELVILEKFDVRVKNEIPNIEDFDIFISSGGPDSPHRKGDFWEKPYEDFLNNIWKYNQTHLDKKYLFLICYSFQVANVYWELGELTKRKPYSFGILKMRKTEEGTKDPLLVNLPDPFYAVDSRAFQVVQPKLERIKKLGMKIVCKEKIRPHVPMERAVMAIRFSDEIFGTQFHPEANPEGFRRALTVEQYKNAIIEEHGLEKYRQTLKRVDDKVVFTRKEIIPRFLEFAARKMRAKAAPLEK